MSPAAGIDRTRVEDMEIRLKQDILKEVRSLTICLVVSRRCDNALVHIIICKPALVLDTDRLN